MSEQLIFAPSAEEVSSVDFNVSIIDDTSMAAGVKQFQAFVSGNQDGVLFAMDNQTAIVNIIDNDGKM